MTDLTAWRTAAQARPGMCVYPEALRPAGPPAPWRPRQFHAVEPAPRMPEPDYDRLTPEPEPAVVAVVLAEPGDELAASPAAFAPLPPVSDEVRVCEPVHEPSPAYRWWRRWMQRDRDASAGEAPR